MEQARERGGSGGGKGRGRAGWGREGEGGERRRKGKGKGRGHRKGKTGHESARKMPKSPLMTCWTLGNKQLIALIMGRGKEMGNGEWGGESMGVGRKTRRQDSKEWERKW